jgi:sugar/nucleoside kinase (ribokinase family)
MSFIAGAGITNIDLLYTGVKRIPEKGEEVYSEGFEMKLGGGAPATLINLARLGVKVKCDTALGDDIFSGFAMREYEAHGITPVNLNTDDEIPLNITSAVILPDDRSFITYGNVTLKDNTDTAERLYNMAHGSDITVMQAGSFFEVYEKLKSEGTTLVFDTGWDDELSLEKYGDYLKLANYYTPNRKEALKITAQGEIHRAAEVLKEYFDEVIIKLDSEGCLYYNGREFKIIPSIAEFNHVDSTGAGDAFLAGLCYGLHRGYNTEDSVLFGNITGGKAVTKPGALSAYCTEDELLEYYNKYKTAG